MNTKTKLNHFLLMAIFVIFLFAVPYRSLAQENGCLCVTAYITITVPSPDVLTMDSLKWKEEKPLIHSFLGKRIKKIIYQQYTDRVIIFLDEHTYLEVNKDYAVNEGIIEEPKTPYPLIGNTPYIPYKPKKSSKPIITTIIRKPKITEIIIDSPLYVRIDNYFSLKGVNMDDYFIPQWEQHFQKDSSGKKIIGNFFLPGPIQLELWSNKSGTPVYRYNLTVKRLPQDELKEEPRFTVGGLDNLKDIDASIFKKQTTIEITKGFKFQSATVYFSGNPFKAVYMSNINSSSLSPCKIFMDECLPGSQITFDMVQVSDSTGKLYYIPGSQYVLTDTSIKNYSAKMDSNSMSYPEYIGGDDSLYAYLRASLAGYTNELMKEGRGIQIQLNFKVLADGTVVDSPDDNLQTTNSLERKCLDIIEKGPKWKPASYRGKNIPLLICQGLNFDMVYY